MITDTETLKMKNSIIDEISKIYEKLLIGGKIDEVRGRKILDYIKQKIQPQYDAKEFTKTISDFSKEFPEFISVSEKVEKKRSELIEKIGMDCLETIMDEETDTWAKLTSTLEQISEVNLHEWFASIPGVAQQKFLSKFLTLSDNG